MCNSYLIRLDHTRLKTKNLSSLVPRLVCLFIPRTLLAVINTNANLFSSLRGVWAGVKWNQFKSIPSCHDLCTVYWRFGNELRRVCYPHIHIIDRVYIFSARIYDFRWLGAKDRPLVCDKSNNRVKRIFGVKRWCDVNGNKCIARNVLGWI